MPDLDDLLPLLWRRPEYAHAWTLAMEEPSHRGPLIRRALRYLPREWADLAFVDEQAGESMVVLFTHDFDNAAARANEARVLLALIEAGALRLFGAEGTSGDIDVRNFRRFPDRDSVAKVAEYLFRENKISPLVLTMFVSAAEITAWGIEDPVLYSSTRDALLNRTGNYYDLIARRVPVLFDNLLLKMRETNEPIAGATITEYNFTQGRRELQSRGISCAGIRARSEGRSTLDHIAKIREDVEPTSPLAKMFRPSDADEAKKRTDYQEWREEAQRGRGDSGGAQGRN